MHYSLKSFILILTALLYTGHSNALFYKQTKTTTISSAADTTWTIVGAGPAGIAVIGMLLDIGIDGKTITWIDPEFNVGRMGAHYYNVPGNALAENYIAFVNECHTFKNYSSPALDYLRNYYPYEACSLHIIIDALRDITAYLKTKVTCHADTINNLQFKENNWHISLKNNTFFTSHNVVLATGSHPRTFNYPCEYTIPLDDALDNTKLISHLQPEDTIGLVGGSHSGTLVLKYLYESKVKRIINFYVDPITYAYDMGNNNTPEYNGLKGDVAQWAFDVLEAEHPASIFRIKNTEIARASWIPICNKIIYAIGYERNAIPLIDINKNDLFYDDTTGIIGVAPCLFGIGFAFPEKIIDQWGKTQHTVGIIDFLQYAQRIVPQWTATKKTLPINLDAFEKLFAINLIQQ